MTFQDLKLTSQYIKAIEEAGFTEPTPIQKKAIPAIMSGQHVIGIAQTGTGKTAAYLLPVLQTIKYAQGLNPRAIIVVPTKELVLQVYAQTAELAKYTDIRFAAIYGGVGKTEQVKKVRAGIDLLITTPRRLVEFHECEDIVLKEVKILIVDEADRMMDMGFMPQIEMLLDILPRKKQNLLFSATFSPKVEKLSENFMDFPVKIEIAPEATAAETVEQISYHTPNIQTKSNLLVWLLRDPSFTRVMVFVKTRAMADEVVQYIHRNRLGPVKPLHANKGQNTRINALQAFKEGEIRVLVATDVTSRGIDIAGVSHVINFEVPLVYEDYIHRIGRTGRAGNEGKAITLVNPAEEWHIQRIEKRIRQSIPLASLPPEIDVPPTPFEEQQDMLRQIDERIKKEDPTYQGAFHEKKDHRVKKKAKAKKRAVKESKGKSVHVSSKTPSSRPKTSKHGRHKKREQ